MKGFEAYLDSIDDPAKRERMEGILNYIKSAFPQLKEEIKWNQPMFTDHGTFIIALHSKKSHSCSA